MTPLKLLDMCSNHQRLRKSTKSVSQYECVLILGALLSPLLLNLKTVHIAEDPHRAVVLLTELSRVIYAAHLMQNITCRNDSALHIHCRITATYGKSTVFCVHVINIIFRADCHGWFNIMILPVINVL
jgi:hypothetical protein